MRQTIELKGLTWDHPRAWSGLYAETRRFNQSQTEIEVHWEKHTLRGFESTPIAETAEKYDLIILDHPFMGDAAASNVLVNLYHHIDKFDFVSRADQYVGFSFQSYEYAGGLWALPVDAACQTAVLRPDLLGRQVPKSFEDVFELAESGGLGLSMAEPHAFMNFLAIAGRLGGDISGAGEVFLPNDIAKEALVILRRLARHIPERAFDWSSIGLLESMATSNEVKYCPIIFCFNTYSQSTILGRHLLKFAKLPLATKEKSPGGSVIGGTGIAISESCNNIQAALKVIWHFAGSGAQKRMGSHGGQPAHRAIWRPDATKTINGSFFDECRSDMETAVLRPRHAGYMYMQNTVGDLLRQDTMNQNQPVQSVVQKIEEHFQESKVG